MQNKEISLVWKTAEMPGRCVTHADLPWIWIQDNLWSNSPAVTAGTINMFQVMGLSLSEVVNLFLEDVFLLNLWSGYVVPVPGSRELHFLS